MNRRAALVLATAAVALTACTSGSPASTQTAEISGAPALKIQVIVKNLDNPWDLAQAPDGTLIFDQRAGGLWVHSTAGKTSKVEADFGDLYVGGEVGLMGIVLDPLFADSGRFYTCQASDPDDDIRVIAWTMAKNYASAERMQSLVTGLPLNKGSNRHGGCRLRFDGTGALNIGTGDVATGTNPQDLSSLGGKTLRVDPMTGKASAGNPFLDSSDPKTQLIYTYGHRNVQGLALRPGTDQMFNAEHGPSVDDEVNLLTAGGNYGWNPVGSGSSDYDESVPMTDAGLGTVVTAVWSSGNPTIATSGLTFLSGKQWGAYDGALLVAALKGQGVVLMRLDEKGKVLTSGRLAQFEGTYGRIRTVQQGTDGALYVTTSNGGDDVILKVTPQA